MIYISPESAGASSTAATPIFCNTGSSAWQNRGDRDWEGQRQNLPLLHPHEACGWPGGTRERMEVKLGLVARDKGALHTLLHTQQRFQRGGTALVSGFWNLWELCRSQTAGSGSWRLLPSVAANSFGSGGRTAGRGLPEREAWGWWVTPKPQPFCL